MHFWDVGGNEASIISPSLAHTSPTPSPQLSSYTPPPPKKKKEKKERKRRRVCSERCGHRTRPHTRIMHHHEDVDTELDFIQLCITLIPVAADQIDWSINGQPERSCVGAGVTVQPRSPKVAGSTEHQSHPGTRYRTCGQSAVNLRPLSPSHASDPTRMHLASFSLREPKAGHII